MFPVPAARHPDLPDLPVRRRGPKRDPGRRGEQRDVGQRLQQIPAVLPGQLQRATGMTGRCISGLVCYFQCLFRNEMVTKQMEVLQHVQPSDWVCLRGTKQPLCYSFTSVCYRTKRMTFNSKVTHASLTQPNVSYVTPTYTSIGAVVPQRCV